MEEMLGQIDEQITELHEEAVFARTIEGFVYLDAAMKKLTVAREYVRAALEAETAASNQLLLLEVGRKAQEARQ